MPARLNRRRYREIVSALKELIADKKAPAARRLRAVETLMEVYRRHDATEAAKEAKRRQSSADSTPVSSTATEHPAPATESATEAAQRFLREVEAN